MLTTLFLPRQARHFGSAVIDIAVRRNAHPAPGSLFSNLETAMTKMIPAALAFAVAVTGAAGAHAEATRIVVLKSVVSYRAADLATPEGAARLLSRVDGAALRMCRHQTSAFDRPVQSEVEACRTKAVSRAVAELDAPLVTAAYANRRATRLAAR